MNSRERFSIGLFAGVLIFVGVLLLNTLPAWAAPEFDANPPPTDTATPEPTDTPEPPTNTPEPTQAAPEATQEGYPSPGNSAVLAEDVLTETPETEGGAISSGSANSVLGFLLCVGVLVVAGLAAMNIRSRRP